jgi:hypothetical protein
MTFGTDPYGEPYSKSELVLALDQMVRDEQRKRSSWIANRAERYAKLRGWLASKDWPWDNASNQHVPVMMANTLRVEAGLFNAVLGHRPVMTPKPFRKQQKEMADKVGDLVDFQIFVESDGEQKIEQYINQFVEDGTVVTFQPWVKDRRMIHDSRIVPIEPETTTRVLYLLDLLPRIMPGLLETTPLDSDGHKWTARVSEASGRLSNVDISVYERSSGDEEPDELEIDLAWKATVHDGPGIVVHQLEDIVVPLRSENLQPLAPANTNGAPWMARLIRVSFDEIKRRMRDGSYNELDDEDLHRIQGLLNTRKPVHVTEPNEDALREQKDAKEGRAEFFGTDTQREWMFGVEWYGRLDVNDDGLAEEVIVTYFREANCLARMRYLTAEYPGLPIRRPFSEGRCFPVAGQFYGFGFPELMEGIHDSLHVLVNQNIDAGTITNTPFFFYRASSGLKPETIRFSPGEGIPLDNPQQDVAFPTFPQRDQQWAFNMIGLWMQHLDKLTQIGPIQQGQVPQGKASALRTTGTTMAILQQGAAMPEQILRRLFMGLKQIWEQYHLLNMRYLPKNKQYLIAGKPADQDDAYGTIKDPQDINIPVAFDFQATLTNTNKGLMQQTLKDIGAALVSPLMLQAGIVKPENIYNWVKDVIAAGQLDPARYVNKPVGSPEGPRHTAEDVMVLILAGQLPEVAPLEDSQTHLAKLQAEIQSDNFGHWDGQHQILLKTYLQRLLTHIRQEQQQQQLMQATGEFNQMMQKQAKGTGTGTSKAPGAPPPMQTEAPTASEQAGADKSHG